MPFNAHWKILFISRSCDIKVENFDINSTIVFKLRTCVVPLVTFIYTLFQKVKHFSKMHGNNSSRNPGQGLWERGSEFESQCRLLERIIFTFICYKNCIDASKIENKRKRVLEWAMIRWHFELKRKISAQTTQLGIQFKQLSVSRRHGVDVKFDSSNSNLDKSVIAESRAWQGRCRSEEAGIRHFFDGFADGQHQRCVHERYDDVRVEIV